MEEWKKGGREEGWKGGRKGELTNSPYVYTVKYCFLGFVFLCFCTSQQSAGYKTCSILVFILPQNLNISNYLEENQLSTLPDFFENCRRKILSRMEVFSAFKINRSVKLTEERQNQEMVAFCL